MSEVSKLDVYLLAVETAKILNKKQKELQNIEWRNGEANLDTGYSQLACICCEEAWNIIKKTRDIYNNVHISCENPDINITFTYSDGKNSKHKIELKSSKSKKIPGSTINKLEINQPLIYCLRPTNKIGTYKIRCSQYYNAMVKTDIDTFQDRTPRPFIHFVKMNELHNYHSFKIIEKTEWIEHYAKCALKRIEENKKSWQDIMIKSIKNIIIQQYIMNTSEEQFKLDKIKIQE